MNLPGYPSQPKRFQVRPGLSMNYLDEGPHDGEVVVMLHGNPSWSYYWRTLVAGLSDKYRCIVPDHVGMGLSDKPDDAASALPRYDYTLRSRVEDLETLLARAEEIRQPARRQKLIDNAELARISTEIFGRMLDPWRDRLAEFLGVPKRRAANHLGIIVAAGRAALAGWLDGALSRAEAVGDATVSVAGLMNAFASAARAAEAGDGGGEGDGRARARRRTH